METKTEEQRKTLSVAKSVDLQSRINKLGTIMKSVGVAKVARLFNKNVNDNLKLQNFLNAIEDDLLKKIPVALRPENVAKKIADLLDPKSGEHVGLIKAEEQVKLLDVLCEELVDAEIESLTAWVASFNLEGDLQAKAAKQLALQRKVWMRIVTASEAYRKIYDPKAA